MPKNTLATIFKETLEEFKSRSRNLLHIPQKADLGLNPGPAPGELSGMGMRLLSAGGKTEIRYSIPRSVEQQNIGGVD